MIEAEEFIPLDSEEMQELFLSVFPESIYKARQWANQLKSNLMVFLMLNEEEIMSFLERCLDQTQNVHQGGQFALDSIDGLKDKALKEFT